MSYRNSALVAEGPDLRWTPLWILGAALVQGTLAHLVAVRGAVPSLVLAAVVLSVIRARTAPALLIGTFAGLVEDSLSASGGAYTVSTAVAAVLVARGSRFFLSTSVVLIGILTIIAVYVRDALFWGVMHMQGYPPGLNAFHLRHTTLQAALTVLVVLIAIALQRRFES